MKRFISVLLTLLVVASACFADEPGDVYEDDDDYIYAQNGAGDQQIKIELGGFFPLNFGTKLYPGIEFTFGYYQFISEYWALGGELSVASSFSIGTKALFLVPVTLGVMFQPVADKFEFPISLEVGVASSTWSNLTYFPSPVAKGSAGVFYRISEGWSFGVTGTFMWIPQWLSETKKNKNGLFTFAGLTARYHF